jgi:hypothetical protein
MPILTLTCPQCGIMLIIGSKNKKAAEAIFDYGKINKLTGKPYQLNCLSCGHAMVKAKAKPEFSKILSDSHNKCKCWHSKDKELFTPAEIIQPNE